MNNPVGRTENDQVRCLLCDWLRPVHSEEMAEHFLQRHLWDAHGEKVRYRVSDGDDVEVDIPPLEEYGEG